MTEAVPPRVLDAGPGRSCFRAVAGNEAGRSASSAEACREVQARNDGLYVLFTGCNRVVSAGPAPALPAQLAATVTPPDAVTAL
jgi:hypothetical protein